MEAIYAMMTFLTVSVAALMIPRIMIDWQRLDEFLREGDYESLRRFAAGQKEWITRHFICAAGATAMVALMKSGPGMARYEGLAEITCFYAMVTFSFIFVESLMAQRAESRLQALRAPARNDHRIGR